MQPREVPDGSEPLGVLETGCREWRNGHPHRLAGKLWDRGSYGDHVHRLLVAPLRCELSGQHFPPSVVLPAVGQARHGGGQPAVVMQLHSTIRVVPKDALHEVALAAGALSVLYQLECRPVKVDGCHADGGGGVPLLLQALVQVVVLLKLKSQGDWRAPGLKAQGGGIKIPGAGLVTGQDSWEAVYRVVPPPPELVEVVDHHGWGRGPIVLIPPLERGEEEPASGCHELRHVHVGDGPVGIG